MTLTAARETSRWCYELLAVREHIVTRNLPLAWGIAGRVAQFEQRDDFRSEAAIALIRAVERFDPTHGIKFSTYAYPAILRQVLKERAGQGRWAATFPATYEPALHEPEQVDLDESDKADLETAIRGADLTDRERGILVFRFGLIGYEAETLDGVGERYDVSKERIRQIETRALTKLLAFISA
jgi:RNA polymerase sigma factor (sigma-70 family)